MQTSLSYRTNRDLFSNYYLEEYLPESTAWEQVSEEALRSAYDEIEALYEAQKDIAPEQNEAQLEEDFIKPIFDRLGITYAVQATVANSGRRPDYAFFESDAARQAAFERKAENGDFYRDASAVADAKRWGRPLDTRGKHKHDFENPSHQIHVYLQETATRWAVLTDGQKWRLYYGPMSHRLDAYYEIDLPTVLEQGDLEDFKYFYLFFRYKGFVEDASGDCFLDDVYDESNLFSQELGEGLQENIYDAIKVLSEGFFQYSGNDFSEETLAEKGLVPEEYDEFERARLDLVHDSALICLYRLIFVLYAESESRELLETDNEIYEQSYSLNSLKRTVAEELDSASPKYQPWMDDLWSRLDGLFELIDQGSESRGIDPEVFYVPAYNGGLFRTDPDVEDDREARFLAEYEVGDSYVARVIELLTRSEDSGGGGKIFVDYSSLDVRHLGSIYEGILEYDIDIADEPLTLDDGEYVPADEGEEVIVEEGELYLLTDVGERKATGSYYTPEYVVEYIVENTLGPLVQEIREDLVGQSAYDEGGFAAEFADRVFDLKVLDPAMGSGHFLTSAVDYLAREIVDAQERQAAQEGIETVDQSRDINWARRQVAQKCIYGVDLNPLATELAKVSLWLRTLAAEQPLAFLDHHLKTGNTLVGSDIEEIDELESDANGGPNASLADFGVVRRGTIDHLMNIYEEFIAIENTDLADAKAMERKYQEIERDDLRNRLVAMANVKTAEDFGLELPSDAYERMAGALDSDSEWADVAATEWCREAQRQASASRYFHWKLEYPEVFYRSDGSEQETPGFDGVIGNPPWVATAGRADISANIDTSLRSYLEDVFEATKNQFDLYVAFYEQSIRQSRNGQVGMIVPDAILTREQNEPIRDFILENSSLSRIVRVGAAFEGVETGAVILVGGADQANIYCADGTENEGLSEISYNRIPEQVFIEQDAKRFLIYLDENTREILRKIENNPPLQQFLSISRGEEISKRAKFLHDISQEGTTPIAPGGAIIQYGINEDELRHIRHSEVKKDEENYRSPKLIFRQTSDSLIGTLDVNNLVTIKSAYNLHSKTDSTGELKHILGTLNSPLLDFYHYYKHAAYRSVFPQINQSTFRSFSIALNDSPNNRMVEVVGERLKLTGEWVELNTNISDYLGRHDEGPSLGELPEYQPADGVAETMITATTKEWPNLKIGSIAIDEGWNSIVLSTSVRYKPERPDEHKTDQYGYTETDPLPAMKFVGLTERQRTLIEAFVRHAVEKGDGFADFYENATKNNSLIDRLEALTLPAIEDVADGLERYRKTKARSEELDEKIEKTDELIDRIVYELYGLTDEEIEIVEESVGDR